MAKAAKKNQTSNGGSSNRKAKNGNGGKGKKVEPEKKGKASNSKAGTETAVEEPKEKKRRGRAPTEGEPLKRVLIFLSEGDVTALKAEVGDRGMSTRIREILKEYLAKRS